MIPFSKNILRMPANRISRTAPKLAVSSGSLLHRQTADSTYLYVRSGSVSSVCPQFLCQQFKHLLVHPAIGQCSVGAFRRDAVMLCKIPQSSVFPFRERHFCKHKRIHIIICQCTVKIFFTVSVQKFHVEAMYIMSRKDIISGKIKKAAFPLPVLI